MDRWISQLYVLTALAILCAVSIFHSLVPSNTQRFKITIGEPDRPVVENRTIPLDRLNSILKELRAISPPHYKHQLVIERERESTPEKVQEYLRRNQSTKQRPILHGVPLGDPNVMQHLADVEEVSSRGT